MRDVIRDKPHRILASYSGEDQSKWSLPDDLSSAGGCRYNQTPEAVLDGQGVIWATWSGRADDTSPWGIYLCRSTGEGWSKPERVSPEGENARAPSICSGPDGSPWLAWHSGTGSAMKVKVKVLRYGPA